MFKHTKTCSILLVLILILNIFTVTTLAAEENKIASTYMTIERNQDSVYTYMYEDKESDYTVVFGSDAKVEYRGQEKGTKNLSYNITPNKDILSKYSDHNLSFLNFPGTPKFCSKANITFFISVNDLNDPRLYQVIGGELYEIEGYARDSKNEAFIFEANSLAESYVISATPIPGISSIKIEDIAETEPDIKEEDNIVVNTENENKEENIKEEEKKEEVVKNPETGVFVQYPVTIIAIMVLLIIGLVVTTKISNKV